MSPPGGETAHQGSREVEPPQTSRIARPFPFDPQQGQTGYIFPTWRAALSDAHARIADAYETRSRMFRKAHEAGLSYREIGEATGLSAAAVGKVLGKQHRTTLDSSVHS